MSTSLEECGPLECPECGEKAVNPMTDICQECGCDVFAFKEEWDWEDEEDWEEEEENELIDEEWDDEETL